MSELLRDWLLDPLALLFLLSVVLGAWLCGSQLRSWLMLLVWVLAFLTASAPAIVNPLIGTLEERYPDSTGCTDAQVIVVLGGGLDSRTTRSDDYAAMTPATFARITSAFELARRYPEVTLVVSGGGRASVTEASLMRDYLRLLGVPATRIVTEGDSRNTRENAERVADLLQDTDKSRGVMLVTSALHMPRAAGDFADMGVRTCPVPVDRLRIRDVPAWALMPQTSALRKFDAWMHELVALMVYRFR